MHNFQYQSPSNKLYAVSLRPDDTGSAHVIGEFTSGRWTINNNVASLFDAPRVALTLKPGTFSKIKSGELLESKLHYNAILASNQPLSAVLA